MYETVQNSHPLPLTALLVFKVAFFRRLRSSSGSGANSDLEQLLLQLLSSGGGACSHR